MAILVRCGRILLQVIVLIGFIAFGSATLFRGAATVSAMSAPLLPSGYPAAYGDWSMYDGGG